MSKKSKSPVHPSDELAAIDEELNAAMELVDVTNVKVNEILGATEGNTDAPATAASAKEVADLTPAKTSVTAADDDSDKEESGDS